MDIAVKLMIATQQGKAASLSGEHWEEVVNAPFGDVPTRQQAEQVWAAVVQPAVNAVAALAARDSEQQAACRAALPKFFYDLKVFAWCGQLDLLMLALPPMAQVLWQLQPNALDSSDDTLAKRFLAALVAAGCLAGATRDMTAIKQLLSCLENTSAAEAAGDHAGSNPRACEVAALLSYALAAAAAEDSEYVTLLGQELARACSMVRQQHQLSKSPDDSSSSSDNVDTAKFMSELLCIAGTEELVPRMSHLQDVAQLTVRQAGSLDLGLLLPADTQLSLPLLQCLLYAAFEDKSRVAAAWVTHLLNAATPEQLLQLPAGLLDTPALLVGVPAVDLEAKGYKCAGRLQSGPLLLKVVAAALQHQDQAGMSYDRLVLALLPAMFAAGRDSSDGGGAAECLVPFAQLLEWLRQQGRQEGDSLQESSVLALLDTMLCCASVDLGKNMFRLSQQESWQLFELLLELQQQQQQQQATSLSLAACNAMIKQQVEPGLSKESAENVLKLLQHATTANSSDSSSTGLAASVQLFEQLSSGSQQAVLAAAARLGQHFEALQLVTQAAAAAEKLEWLLDEWEQQLAAVAAAGSGQESAAQQAEAVAGEAAAPTSESAQACGLPPSVAVYQAAVSASLELNAVELTPYILWQLQQVAPSGSSLLDLISLQQLEQCLQLLCAACQSCRRH
jgi:hypothetical protein